MKAVLISIQPKWCELIASGKKTIEVRKTRPKIETPFKCYIYCTEKALLTKSHCDGHIYVAPKKKYKKALENAGNITLSGKVIGEFVCRGIMRPNNNLILMAKGSLLTEKELFEYSNGKKLYGWRISDLKIYDKLKKLGEFYKKCKLDPDECGNCDFHGLIRKRYEIIGHCFADGKKKITRPPQSWCYVEESK
jgi:predicted transcriptional regulator